MQILSKASKAQSEVRPSNVVQWSWWRALLLGMTALIGADILMAIIFGVLAGAFHSSHSLHDFFSGDSITANFVFYALSRLLGLSLIVLFLRKYSLKLKQLGFKKFKVLRALGLVALAVITLLFATSIVFLITEKLAPTLNLSQDQDIVFAHAKSVPEIGLAFVALVLVAPIAEEIIFRGFMLPSVAKRFGWGVATIVTALLFGLVHGQVNVGIVTFIMGILLAWLYKKTGSLWPAILFHSLKNLIAFLIIFK